MLAYNADTEYELVVHEVEPPEAHSSERKEGGQTVGKLDATTDPDAKLCDNCRSYISSKTYMTHSIQCPRLNVWCDECKSVIKRTEKEKHVHCQMCK